MTPPDPLPVTVPDTRRRPRLSSVTDGQPFGLGVGIPAFLTSDGCWHTGTFSGYSFPSGRLWT